MAEQYLIQKSTLTSIADTIRFYTSQLGDHTHIFDPSLTNANGLIEDATIIIKHFYENFDSNGEFSIGPSGVEGTFTGTGYEANNDGYIVPVLYAPTGNGDDDTFFYVGIDEIGGVFYDKWRKIEYFDENYDLSATYYTWDGEAKCYVYTDRIVVKNEGIKQLLSPLEFSTKIAEVYECGRADAGAYQEGYQDAEAITKSLIERTITEYVIPEGTTIIGPHAFAYCNKLARVSIPDGVEKIGASAFQSAVLTELVLPLSCKYIDTWGLYGMTNVQSIVFGDLTYMGPNSAANNAKCMLYDFTRCTTVPELYHTNAFTGINANAKMLVPAALYDEWIVATNWAEYADYIVPGGFVASRGLDIDAQGNLVGRGTCTDTVIVVPDEVKWIAMYSFVEDATLDTLILPEREIGVYIDDYSVYGSGLRVVENFYSSSGLALTGTPLELVTFLPSASRIQIDALNLSSDATYDFTRHTEVPILDAFHDYYDVSAGTKFLVPASLYDEWINATNWTLVSPYIFPAETE